MLPGQACGGAQGRRGTWGGWGHRDGAGAPWDSVALSHPSITPPASTVSAVCQASTAPQTTPRTHPTLAAVSGAPLSGRPGDRDSQEPGLPGQGCPRVSSSLRPPGPLCSGRPGHGSHPTAQTGLIALGLGSHDFPAPGPHPGCNCESDFTDGTCEDLTGRCYCRPRFTGEWCDACAEGFTGFPLCYREGASLGVGGLGGPFCPAWLTCCVSPIQRCPPTMTPGNRYCRPDRL